MEGFDYTSVSPAAAKAAGASFVVRYLGTTSKCITASERDALHTEGIAIGLVFETTGTTFTGGYAAGQKDGSAAWWAAHSLGVPDGTPIWFAIDTDTSDFFSVKQYLAGCVATSGAYKARIYASFKVIEALGSGGHWQTYAWSGGSISTHADLYQYHNGAQMDNDRTLNGNLGNHGGWLTYAPAPVTPAPVTPAPTSGVPVTTYPDAVSVAKQRIANHTKIGPNMCLVAVRTAFGLQADGHEPTAYSAWVEAGGHDGPNTHYSLPAPADVPVYFKDRNPDGHIAIAAGGGNCYTTDFNGTHWVDDGHTYLVSIASITSHGGMAYLGWSETLENVRIHAHITA